MKRDRDELTQQLHSIVKVDKVYNFLRSKEEIEKYVHDIVDCIHKGADITPLYSMSFSIVREMWMAFPQLLRHIFRTAIKANPKNRIGILTFSFFIVLTWPHPRNTEGIPRPFYKIIFSSDTPTVMMNQFISFMGIENTLYDKKNPGNEPSVWPMNDYYLLKVWNQCIDIQTNTNNLVWRRHSPDNRPREYNDVIFNLNHYNRMFYRISLVLGHPIYRYLSLNVLNEMEKTIKFKWASLIPVRDEDRSDYFRDFRSRPTELYNDMIKALSIKIYVRSQIESRLMLLKIMSDAGLPVELKQYILNMTSTSTHHLTEW